MPLNRLRIYLFGLNDSELQEHRAAQAAVLPTPDGGPVPMPADPEAHALPAVKNWGHPFRDKNHSLHQLTHLAKAAAGFYPPGVNGLWHGGVHFDGGTAGTVDQSSVHCLADGEVVAYRIDQHSPTTGYIAHRSPVLRPFSRNFVLVRHRFQPPKIDGSPDTPPSLTVYSLYMHLQDWAVYQQDPQVARPGFWPEGVTRQVKATVNDVDLDNLNERGLNIRNQASKGKIIGFLPKGAEVTVSGKGAYRRLENTLGPDKLKNPDGSLRGYVAASHLLPINTGEYRVVTQNGPLTVRADADRQSPSIGVLQQGTEVKVSGEGDYRKLEQINQYVHFNSLQGVLEPLAHDRVVMLDTPVPIKAGDLIGHIGLYQDSHDDPEKRLHLEVFSGDNVKAFIEASRAWALRLPATSKTWLKLVKGTAVVAHQEEFSDKQPPTLKADYTPSDADLLVPKSLLDGLPATKKIKVPAASGRKACIWYRIEGLLHDAEQTLLDGWVCEEVGVTPWVSPWSWENYDLIYNNDDPRHLLTSYLRATGQFNEAQLERWGPVADMADTGPLKSRLYDIIDRNRDGTITAKEIQSAISLPAHAQPIAQLIIFAESEWCYTRHKWDSLDEPSGHTSSTPHLNWFSEKDRIREISWWGDVAEKLGLRADGKVYHFHPVGLVGSFGGIVRGRWELGFTSERYESAGRGPGVISTGRGDHGGASYGVYQMSSKMGVVQNFIKSSRYSSRFAGLQAGSGDFNNIWKEIANENAGVFKKAQHDYIKSTHYDVQLNEVLKGLGFPLENKSAALHDLVWSTTVQFGPKTKLIKKATAGLNFSSASVVDIVSAVQDFKISHNNKLFASSPTLHSGLIARAIDEKSRLLDLEASGFEIE